MESIKQFDIWIAELSSIEEERVKLRPVIILQTDLMNTIHHPSTLICPITSNVIKRSEFLRVHLPEDKTNLNRSCDIMIDQLRAIDKRRLNKYVGPIPEEFIPKIKKNIQIVLGLE